MIVGLAGHVDHGKSALVTALTGLATDRQREERERGITIDLQAVPLRNDAGDVALSLIDVPGHEDFVRTMVASTSGIEAVLLVVAADEGVMPQTREHLLIAEQLGVTRGLSVVTKSDLVDPELGRLAVEELGELLASSSIEFESPRLVSVRNGEGVPELRERLLSLVTAREPAEIEELFRLPVDRIYHRQGIGAILSGTSWSGRVAVGDLLRLLPMNRELRVRSIEAHGRQVSEAGPRLRVAIAVSGLERDEAHRGAVLVHAGDPWPVSAALGVEVTLARSAERPLDGRRRIRFHLGTTEIGARLLPRQRIEPGKKGFARVVLDHGVPVRGQDRFIFRSWSPATTIGGGVVVDPVPPPRAAWPAALAAPSATARLEALCRRRRFGRMEPEMPFLLGLSPAALSRLPLPAGIVRVAGRFVPAEEVAGAEEAVLARLAAFHEEHPAEVGISVETLRQGIPGPAGWGEAVVAGLVASDRVRSIQGIAALTSFAPQSRVGREEVSVLAAAIRKAGLAAPDLGELAAMGFPDPRPALRLAEANGGVVPLGGDRWVSREATDRLRELLREIAADGPITLAAVRERTGLSRKYLIPLLEWADQSGWTRREGEARRLIRGQSA